MSLTKRIPKGSPLSHTEMDDNWDWVNKGGEETLNTVFLNRGGGNSHAAANGDPLTGGITVDLTGAENLCGVMINWSGAANPTINIINGSATLVYPNGDSISASGTYKIMIMFVSNFDANGEVQVFIPGASGGTAPDTTAPTLSNFRILANEPTRIYYDSSEPISGTTFAGFTLTGGKTITGNSISAGNTTGHFLTVATAYTNGDGNDGIAYDGTDDIGDTSTGNNQLAAFGTPTPVTVTNNVPAAGVFADFTEVWSTVKIDSAYSGNGMQLRRGVGGGLAIVGYDGNGHIDEAAAAVHHNSDSDLYIDTWYGESGKNLTAASTGEQPRFFDLSPANDFERIGLRSAALGFNTQKMEYAGTIAGLAHDADFTIVWVAEPTVDNTQDGVFTPTSGGNSRMNLYLDTRTGGVGADFGDGATLETLDLPSKINLGDRAVQSVRVTGGNATIRLNGTNGETAAIPVAGTPFVNDVIRFFTNSYQSLSMSGKLQMFAFAPVYKNDTEMAAIEAEIDTLFPTS